jgi:hypothetical protein
VAEPIQPFNSLVALAEMAGPILEQVAVVAAVPQGQMVRVALAGQIVPRQQQLVVAVAAVTAVEQDRVHPQQAERQELVLVLGVLVGQQTHQAVQAGLALTQLQPMSFLVAAVAVLVMVQALQLVVLAGIMVLAGAEPQRLHFPLEALDQLVRWSSPIRPWRLSQPNQLQQLPE